MREFASQPRPRPPDWIKKKVTAGADFSFTRDALKGYNINTVCVSARCPNVFDCFSRRVVTFLILGDVCTRNCGFCFVKNGEMKKPDKDEPARVAEIACRLKMDHIVITSVTRDDLSDGGAGHFSDTVKKIRDRTEKHVSIEALVPDLKASEKDIATVANAGLNIFGHNVETVPGLYRIMRPAAVYGRSIEVLRLAKKINPALVTKSSVMLGLGEKMDEVVSVMKDLRSVNCDMIAIGQYLRPSHKQAEVRRFVSPDEFLKLKEVGLGMGFRLVSSGPFVRSSYTGGDYD